MNMKDSRGISGVGVGEGVGVGVVVGRAVVDDGVGPGVEMGVEAGSATHIPCMLSSVPLGQMHRNDPTVFSQD